MFSSFEVIVLKTIVWSTVASTIIGICSLVGVGILIAKGRF